ncbi:MAG: type II toxin-antitoxin system RelE/ParE family toxin [Solirubrobacterales bacterium]
MKLFIEKLSEEDVAAVATAMHEVRVRGLPAARHLGGNIYEVRASGNRAIYRILFAPQGKHGQVLLALEAFKKKSQKTPLRTIRLARQRLQDWERRGRSSRKQYYILFDILFLI